MRLRSKGELGLLASVDEMHSSDSPTESSSESGHSPDGGALQSLGSEMYILYIINPQSYDTTQDRNLTLHSVLALRFLA